jgi:tetratricopeptide (TPR) repeat protein
MSTTVFISYSHDSDEHREQVLALSERLRKDGIETLLDQYVNGTPPEGWPRWMMNQLDAAGYVLVVCTETYYRRFRGREVPGKGKGVDWEGALITSDLYAARSQSLKFVPVFFSSVVEDYIPDPLRAGTHYAIVSERDYQSLYDFLLQQAGVEPGPVGTPKIKIREKGTALTFDASTLATRPADISRIMKYAPSDLIGREAETKLLSDAWDQVVRGETNRPHILTFVALGGEGKTSVAAKWAVDLASQDWPDCDAVLAWSFYSQGTREQLAASSDLFLNEALTFFGDAAMAGSATSAFDKGRRLAQLVGQRRAVLILDGLEPLQYAPTSPTPGELKDQGIAALLKGLAANSRSLCVVTTRYSIPDLRAYVGKTVEERKLARLSTEAGVSLLQSFGVKGSLRKAIPSSDGRTLWNEFEKLVEDVKGHALTLNLLGSYLRDAHGGDIRKRDLIRLSDADAEEQGGHAFHVMDAYVESLANGGKTPDDQAKGRRALAMLRLLGLFDRPASAGTLAALWEGEPIAGLTEPLIGISEAQRNIALQRLEDAKLLTGVREHGSGLLVALDAHPLLREYFGQRLRDGQPDAWRAAHRRIYKHLCATTEDKPDATLEDLLPLYQAVAHGCHAGLQQETCDKVYFDRIQRGEIAYSTKKLGALGSDLGAVACFFETPWSRVSPALTEGDQAWLLNEAAFTLRALGRLAEALDPTRAGLDNYLKQERWGSAARLLGTLSELELTSGEVAGAVADAEEAVTFADRGGDAFECMAVRTIHAAALHQAGRRDEAEARFREAEQMQAESQRNYPLLYSVQGFHYCDLLLSESERKAGKPEQELNDGEHLVLCGAVAERATQALKWVTDAMIDLLSIALDRLTLGRAALYAAILESRNRQHELAQPSPLPTSEERKRRYTTAVTELEHAVSGLRRAGVQHHLPRALLTRAWLRSLTDVRTGSESAQSDLDEAWEIAERGPMPLFLADIHLYRARLFFREATYPWESPQHDLNEARRLIFKHGYLRREEELKDAEAALEQFVESQLISDSHD